MKRVVLHVDLNKVANMRERSLLGFTLLCALITAGPMKKRHRDFLEGNGVQIIAQEEMTNDGAVNS